MLNKEILDNLPKIKQYIKSLGFDLENVKDEVLLLTAFVHKSYSADYKNEIYQNERLEFLWDSVLWNIIAKRLYIDFPEYQESTLTLYKISLVREQQLAEVARDIWLWEILFLWKWEHGSGGRNKDSILCDGLEALIWYVYLDMGIQTVEEFITQYIYIKVKNISRSTVKSAKSILQEKIQKKLKVIPEYIDIEYELDEKKNVLVYKSEIYINNEKISEWYWKNKKTAQEDAAKKFLEII